jgi:hypothetical protein
VASDVVNMHSLPHGVANMVYDLASIIPWPYDEVEGLIAKLASLATPVYVTVSSIDNGESGEGSTVGQCRLTPG